MSSESTNTEIARRQMLSMMVGSACYAAHPRMLNAALANHLHIQIQQAANGTAASKRPPAGIFSQTQLNTIAALTETIIPTDSHSPGARAAGVDKFVNETVSTSPLAVQKLWVDGVAAMDRMAQRDYGKAFADCEAAQQIELLGRISLNEDQPSTLEERFFVVLKQSTVQGYYLSDIGIHQELQYQGNAVLSEFPGCTHEEHKAERKPER